MSQMDDKEQITKLYHDMYAAMVAKDEAELNRVHDESFVLIHIHAGTHLVSPMKKLFMKSKKIFAAVCVAVVCISVYGCAAFIKRGFPGYMLGQTMFAFFDYSEPRVFFFLDYLAIMVLFMMIGCLIIYGLSKVHTKAEK